MGKQPSLGGLVVAMITRGERCAYSSTTRHAVIFPTCCFQIRDRVEGGVVLLLPGVATAALVMPWLEEESYCGKFVPSWVIAPFRKVISLRASPKLLVIVCAIQFVVLFVGVLQQLNRVECTIALPSNGPVSVECDTCRNRTITTRSIIMNLGGAIIIASGLLAVRLRDQRLLFVYGTVMLFFSLVIGLTAMLTALETPVLEVAVVRKARARDPSLSSRAMHVP
jgi:hypothetical protein